MDVLNLTDRERVDLLDDVLLTIRQNPWDWNVDGIALFSSGNSFEDLLRIRNEYAAARGVTKKLTIPKRELRRLSSVAAGCYMARSTRGLSLTLDEVLTTAKECLDLTNIMPRVTFNAYKREGERLRLIDEMQKARKQVVHGQVPW